MTQVSFKIPPRLIPSYDCLIYPDRKIEGEKIVEKGEAIAVHRGEWIEVVPVQSMKELIALGRIASLVSSEFDMSGRAGEASRALVSLCTALAARITAWNWTDNAGLPLPQPYEQPDVLAALSNDELMYLVQASRGETPEERKKD